MNEIDRDIGRLIRKARQHLKYSTETVAEELGIPEDRLLQYELGDARPAPFQLLAICALLRVQPAWFFPEVWGGVVPESQEPNAEPEDQASEPAQIVAARSKTSIEILFQGDIRILVGKDFDEKLLRQLVSVLRAM